MMILIPILQNHVNPEALNRQAGGKESCGSRALLQCCPVHPKKGMISWMFNSGRNRIQKFYVGKLRTSWAQADWAVASSEETQPQAANFATALA